MADQTIKLYASNAAWKGSGKPYIAKINGLDTKFGFEREFMPKSVNVIEPGIYEVCDYDKKDRKDASMVLIFPWEDGLDKFYIRDDTAVEILKSKRPIAELAPFKNQDGKWALRKDGKIQWKTIAHDLATLQVEYRKCQDRMKELEIEMAMFVQQA